MTFLPNGLMQNTAGNDADAIRRSYGGLLSQGGVNLAGDCLVTQHSPSAEMSVDVAPGSVWVQGTAATGAGWYPAFNDAAVKLSVGAAHASLTRQDLVIVRVLDKFYGRSSDVGPSAIVVPGTPGSGVDPTIPAGTYDGYETLARITVPALATQITNSNITDLRRHALALYPANVVLSAQDTTAPKIRYGEVTLTFATANSVSAAITFPAGTFANKPKLFLGIDNNFLYGKVSCSFNGLSTTGATISVALSDGSTITGTFRLDWLAVGV